VTIYLDLDGDGTLSAGDVSTVSGDDNPATSGVDETGWYAFDHLPIGQYAVHEVPGGYVQTAPLNPNYYLVDLRCGAIASGLDFGNQYQLGSISGHKYLDANFDGVYESGEPGQSGVTMYLDLNENGQLDVDPKGNPVEPTATTDGAGNFQFTGLVPRRYVVREKTPDGFQQAVPAGGQGIVVDLLSGQSVIDLLFVNQDLRGLILGFKWIDLDGDGERDPGEPGSPGVRVYLDKNGNGVWDTSETYVYTQSDNPATAGADETGLWEFDNVVPGSYTVREESPAGYDPGYPGTGGHQVTVGARQTVATNILGQSLWFGNIPHLPGIEGWKFDDRNHNGQRDRNRLQGDSPLLVCTFDASQSTVNPFNGNAPGDVNGDSEVDTVLDGELAALIAVNEALIAAGLGTKVSVAVVAFGDHGYPVDLDPTASSPLGTGKRTAFPSDDADANGVPDVEQVLRSLKRSLLGLDLQTNYGNALKTVSDTISAAGVSPGSANLLFLSDGHPNNYDYDDEVASLRSAKVNLNAFGAGRDAYLYPLQRIDSQAERFTGPGDLVAKFLSQFDPGGSSSVSWPMTSADGRWLERGLPNVTVYLDDNDNARLDWADRNGNGVWDAGEGERWTLTAWDDPATTGVDETGYYRFDNLAPGTYTVREIVPTGWTETTPASEDFNGLAAFYPFEGNANSTTGALPAGTVVGATFTTDRFGNANSALSFDGVDDEVQLGSWFNYQNFTLALWVNAGPTQKQYADIIDDYHTGGQNWVVQHGTSVMNHYYLFTAGTNGPGDEFGLTSGTWQYLVLTHSSRDRTNTVYLDGVPVVQNVGTATAITYVSPFLRLGNWGGGGRNWNGLMDDFRVYSRELTANEVNHLYQLETRQVTASPGYVVRVDYGDMIGGIDFGNYDPNGPPEVVLAHVIQAIAENADTTAATPVADVVPVDSSLDPATLVLTGADAGQFELVAGKLYLKSGVSVDHETNPRLEVTVQTTTPAGDVPDPAATLFITVTDVNERPTVRLTNARTLLAGDANTSSRWKAADIAIEDDALGTNNLSLSGPDAAMFEIVAQSLYLKAGAVLDYAANPVLDVTVEVDDPDVGVSPDGTASLAVKLTDPGLPTLDVDANGLVEPMSDGMLVLRYCFDFAGPALVSRVLGSGATRTEPGRVAAFLGTACSSMLDVDGSGAREPFADGLLLLRYLFDFRGTALTRGLIGSTAQRTTPEAIVAFLNGFLAAGAKSPAKENATAETIVGVDKAAPYEVTVPLKRRDRHHFRLSDGL
jgi:protocatechuate 3,4-dioxygenase beta subunit